MTLRKNIALVAALCAFLSLILASDAAIISCRAALTLCMEVIVPSLFPFFVLSIALNKLGLPSLLGRFLAPFAARLYGVSGAGASALFIGLTGGYPLGAKYIADMQSSGAVTVNEAERLLAFCNNSGPAFIVGAVGLGVFHSSHIGLFLYGVHVLSALLTGLFFRSRSSHEYSQPLLFQELSLSSALPEAVKQALDALLSVCGFVVFFTVLTGILDAGGLFSLLCGRLSSLFHLELHFSRALLTGILELGSGAAAMRGLAPVPVNLSLAAFLLGWGGLSVHMQTAAVLAQSNVKGALHFAGRLISASVAAVLAYAAAPLFV